MRERGERPAAQLPPEGATEKPKYVSPINWWRLDPLERAEVLEVLADWVPELVRRYGLTDQVVPRCWFRHEALVQELLALYQYRNQQQVLPEAPPGAMLDFHYQYQLAIGRLRFWVQATGCNQAEHMETPVPGWALEESVEHAKHLAEIDVVTEALRRDAYSGIDEEDMR